ncbi:toxin [Massilia sp. YIM B04103]|uniref:toxin n=1 Tax=Massilia sp. YIM B04103 TaxID=2963106 RepID=UPI00210A15D9|nr:toxin [Massilia sp. YIM B04103]
MQVLFIELPAFARLREQYLDDEAYRQLQAELLRNPEAGALLRHTGGLRKLRFQDRRRHKGKRGGLRVIYYWAAARRQCWLFTLFDKDETDDLSADECKLLRQRLYAEIAAREVKP